HVSARSVVDVRGDVEGVRREIARSADLVPGNSGGEQRMAVRRNLLNRERDLLRASGLREDESAPLLNRKPPAQVGQREGGLPVASVGGADQLEQRLVLRDRQQLTLAQHP